MASKKTKAAVALTPLAWTVDLIGAAGVAAHACCGEEDVVALLKDEGAELAGTKATRLLKFAQRQHYLGADHPANILLTIRHAAGLTAHQVAEGSGLRAPVINRLEGGHTIPTVDSLARLFNFWRAKFPELHMEDLCLANAVEMRQRVARWRSSSAEEAA